MKDIDIREMYCYHCLERFKRCKQCKDRGYYG